MQFTINPIGSGAYSITSQIYAPLCDDDGNIIVDDGGLGIGTYAYQVTLKITEHYGYELHSVTVDGKVVGSTTNITFVAFPDAQITINFTKVSTVKPFNVSSYNVWRGFVKDAMDLENEPKAFLTILSHNIRLDLLTTANSEFVCLEVPDNVSNGDILMVTNPQGVTRYVGIIKSIEDTKIQTYQMQHFYSGKWVYENSANDDKSWYLAKYTRLTNYPAPSDFEGLTPTDTKVMLDQNITAGINWGDNYSAYCVTYVYCPSAFTQTISVRIDDWGTVYLNDTSIGTSANVATNMTFAFTSGWNKVEVCYTENTGNDGFLFATKLNSLSGISIQSSEMTGVIEDSIVNILTNYANGYMLGSTYQDTLVSQLKSSVTITAGSSTLGTLETKDPKTVEELETFIYDMYQKYNVLLDFNIQYSGTNSVTVWKPNYSTIKIGNNTNAVVNISPITKVEETNRLIIYDKNGVYRNTYVAKSDGTVVSEPSATTNRFNVVNTKIVFSDDEENDLIKANLPTEMYNHKLTFTLRINNNLYSFDDLKLGRPLAIWIDGNYYSTIITGMSYKKDNNQPVVEVEFTCGMVRTSLSDKLSLRLGVI